VNRRRSKSRANFPRNLYENKGYFSWRNPTTGEYFGLGTNRARAFEEALQLNLHLAKLKGHKSIIDRVFGGTQTVAAWEEKYQGVVEKRGLTKETRSNYLAFSRRVVKMLGDRPMRSVTAQQVSDGLEAIAETEGMPRTAQAMRAYMRQSFETAVSAGWIDANPVRANIIVGDKSAKRARLSLDVFMKVYESAPTEWLRNALALALVSAQRREDVARAEFKDFRDGGWWLTQASEKTDHPHRLFIPYDLKPVGFDSNLGSVVAQCRRSGVVSRYLVHQSGRRAGRSSVGREIRLSTVSSAFSRSVEALGIDWSPKTPPTFHEIRSLALRLYGDQGVNVQLLAGHSDPDTTSIYLNSRGQDYVRVTV
jgi:enterobacteria phage integrase